MNAIPCPVVLSHFDTTLALQLVSYWYSYIFCENSVLIMNIHTLEKLLEIIKIYWHLN